MQADFHQKLQELKQGYIESLPGVIAKIGQATVAYLEGDREPGSLREFFRAVHSLTGSGATYGFQQISTEARELENTLKPCLDEAPVYPEAERIKNLFLSLDACVSKALEGGLDDEPAQNTTSDTILNKSIRPAAIKILVADDDHYSRERIATMLEMDGHTVFQAADGQLALRQFEQEAPDLVLMDAIMPVMNGFEAVRLLKERCSHRFVPVIFLTALEKEEELVACVENGGDDFLVKPVNHIILNARILAMQRIMDLNRELERYQSEMEEELRLTKHVFDFVINRNPKDFPGLEVWMQACSHFSGDMFSCNTSPHGDRYAMLGDFTGHGMRAAVGIIPVSDIFYTMSSKGISLDEIIGEINDKLRLLLPTGQFLCAFFVRFDARKGIVEVCNVGLPAAYLFRKGQQVLEAIHSSNLPLGVLADTHYESSVQVFPVEDVESIVAYTDGLTELRNSEGEMLGEETIEKLLLQCGSEDSVRKIREMAEGILRDKRAEDDISIFRISS